MTPRQVEYAEYRKTPHWRRLRKAVIKRDGRKCTRCLSRHMLQAHHLIYRDRFEDSVPSDLVTLCQGCHKKEHGLVSVPVVLGSSVPKRKHRRKNSKLAWRRSSSRSGVFNHGRRKKKHKKFIADNKCVVRGFWPGMYEGKAPGEVSNLSK